MYYLQSRYYDPSVGRFVNGDRFIYAVRDVTKLSMFVYCGNNPVNNSDPNGDEAISITVVGAIFVLVMVAYLVYLVYLYAIRNLLRTFPQIKIQKVTVRSSKTEIPNRLIDQKTGNVNLGKFKNKVKGKTAYKESDGWSIEKDTAGHGGRKWKLKNKSGKRVASLDGEGKILSN